MSRLTSLSGLLDELSPDVPETEPVWEDVLARAALLAGATSNGHVPAAGSRLSQPPLTRRRFRRRSAVAFGIAALVFAVVAAAYALGHPVVDFGKAPKGSRTVVNYFGRLTIGVPTGAAPDVLPHQARQITNMRIDGKDHLLWVAPVKQGGFCYGWSGGLWGSCGPSGDHLQVMGIYGQQRAITLLGGFVLKSTGVRLVMSFADGQTEEIPFTWVTAPINAGFYLYGIPTAHQRQGHQAASIALLDSTGHVLESEPVDGIQPRRPAPKLIRHRISGYPPLMVPAQAEWSKRQQLFALRASDGVRIGLWVAPERGGGTCFWSNQASGCWNPRYPFYLNPPATSLWLRPKRGRKHVNLCCIVAKNVNSVEARFQDGEHVELIPKDGYLLWPIPERHYPPGHRLDQLVAYNAAGAAIGASTVRTDIRALYPCTKPTNYGYGLVMCP